MCLVHRVKAWCSIRKTAFLNLWHFIYYAVILSGLPLLLTVSFSIAAGDGWESLVSHYLSDVLLTTFALAICICGELSQSNYKENLQFCRDFGWISALICFACYLAFYHMESAVRKVLGDDSWNILQKAEEPIMRGVFIVSLTIYVFNILLGIYVTNFHYKKTQQKT